MKDKLMVMMIIRIIMVMIVTRPKNNFYNNLKKVNFSIDSTSE